VWLLGCACKNCEKCALYLDLPRQVRSRNAVAHSAYVVLMFSFMQLLLCNVLTCSTDAGTTHSPLCYRCVNDAALLFPVVFLARPLGLSSFHAFPAWQQSRLQYTWHRKERMNENCMQLVVVAKTSDTMLSCKHGDKEKACTFLSDWW